jgi:hypothetical protein
MQPQEAEPSAQRRSKRLLGDDVLAGAQGRGDGIGHHGDRQDQQHDVDSGIGQHGA